MYKISVRGTDAAIQKIRNKRRDFDKILKTALRVSALQVEKQAKINCPVKTGNLRRSIMSVESNNGMTIAIGPDIKVAPYAIWVEQGHSQQPGRYVPALGKRLVADFVRGKWYMQRTYAQMRTKVTSNIKQAFRRAVI